MTTGHLLRRNLLHFWRTNLAVVAGVATSVAVLSGALLVGESVRGSLRNLLLERLGATAYVVAADRYFREGLAGELASAGGAVDGVEACPIIFVQGVVVHEPTGRRAHGVNVYGIDDRFWRFHGAANHALSDERTTLVGAGLADSLGVRAGDGLLLRIETNRGIPRESVFGRREDVGRTVRLVSGEVLSASQLGDFALQPGQGHVRSLFVPLQRLQQVLGQSARANAVLLASRSRPIGIAEIRTALKSRFTLQDVGVSVRPLPAANGVAVESTRVLIEDTLATGTFGAAADLGLAATGVYSYLANVIRARGHEIPYSVIAAAGLGLDAPSAAESGVVEGPALSAMRSNSVEGPALSAMRSNSVEGPALNSIWLTEWAWSDLGASLGDTVEVDYYQWQEEGSLVTRTARFRLAGRAAIGRDVDATFAPEFPGISEARSISAWDPPFPLDLRRIRARDEDFWNRYRATPKGVISLAAGQQLWSTRFGQLTAVRVHGVNVDKLAETLRRRIDPEQTGFTLTAVRQRGLEASRGSTDFGQYFVYFSFFLIVSAILLAALFFRLGVEQRAREFGTLLAVGYSTRDVHRIFLLEGAVLSLGGGLLGVVGAIAYGGLMIAGLRTWWIGAVGTRQLALHVSLFDLGLGAGAGVLVSLTVIAWTLRGLRANSPRALVAGVLEASTTRRQRRRLLGTIAALSILLAALLLVGSALGALSDVGAFFGAGGLLLASALCVTAVCLRRDHPHPLSGHGWRAIVRLGARNAAHRPGRSLLCIALVASAAFVIVSVEAFRKDPQHEELGPRSGTGGYPLLAQSSLPIVFDPNSADGREALGIPPAEVPELSHVRFVPFRERPGDDASCVNLYAPQEPRILGASHAFVAAGRFSFQASLAATPEERRNPWLLLESIPKDGSIPAIGDANTIQYSLHRSVGDELTVRGSGGAAIRLRLVGALRDSMLQGELVVADANFRRAFPGAEGYRFFLLDVPAASAESLVEPLQERLSDWGFAVERSRDRLAAYHRVENTYLSTFQALGALGLVLGTIGLSAVLLRNVLERRKELALLRAVGYRQPTLALIIVSENVLLMLIGLGCGTIPALVAIVPAIAARGGAFPFGMIALLLVTVLVAGVLSSLLAVAAAFRSPLLSALRSE
jgi:ABC-type antimicrobial peptide transport system permease subunit